MIDLDYKVNDSTTEDSSNSIKNLNVSDCYKIKNTRLIRQKTEEEVAFLETQFEKDPTWSRATVQYCKNILNLGTTQIYKWGFDKKLSLERKAKKLLRQKQNPQKRRRRRKANPKPRNTLKDLFLAEGDLEDSRMKMYLGKIDYNKEVSELINLVDIQNYSDSSSGTSLLGLIDFYNEEKKITKTPEFEVSSD